MPPPTSPLLQNYTLHPLSISPSTQISTRTTAVINALGTIPAAAATSLNTSTSTSKLEDKDKPVIVVLTARSKAANKLITIVEIVKRELAGRGVAVYQYTAVGGEVRDVVRDEGGEEGGDEAFERGTKKKNVPVLTVYLCGVGVGELKAAYG